MKTIGFIGTGNMGGALAKAVAKKIPGSCLYLADTMEEKARALAQQLGANVVSPEEAAKCAYVFLGVKPQMLQQLFDRIGPVLAQRQDEVTLISMAAGMKMARICQMAGGDYPIIRIMPNMPVGVGGGVVLYDHTPNVTGENVAEFCDMMSWAGILDPLPESLMDAGTSVSGCGPAFAFLFIEALAKGGVACGLSEEQAVMYAKQTLLGSAMLALQSDQTPGALREAVCSPGGSTIEGVKVLWEKQFPEAVCQAVMASWRRNQELGK